MNTGVVQTAWSGAQRRHAQAHHLNSLVNRLEHLRAMCVAIWWSATRNTNMCHAAGLCSVHAYQHPYTGRRASWWAIIRAMLCPACLIGENELLLLQSMDLTERPVARSNIGMCTACCADRSLGYNHTECSPLIGAAGVLCLCPILWAAAYRQRKQARIQYHLSEPCPGSVCAALIASLCMPCALLQLRRFLDERLQERCGSSE
jgi:hypothetical protein